MGNINVSKEIIDALSSGRMVFSDTGEVVGWDKFKRGKNRGMVLLKGRYLKILREDWIESVSASDIGKMVKMVAQSSSGIFKPTTSTHYSWVQTLSKKGLCEKVEFGYVVDPRLVNAGNLHYTDCPNIYNNNYKHGKTQGDSGEGEGCASGYEEGHSDSQGEQPRDDSGGLSGDVRTVEGQVRSDNEALPSQDTPA